MPVGRSNPGIVVRSTASVLPMRLFCSLSRLRSLSAIAVIVGLAAPISAQQVRPRSGFEVPVQSNVSSGAVDIPQTNLAPINAAPSGLPPSFTPPPLGSNFDPYAMNADSQLSTIPSNTPPGVIAAPSLGVPSSPGVTSIGPPTAIAPYPPTSTGGIAPSPPGGSLFSRIFSRPASSPTFAGPAMSNPPNLGAVYDNQNVYGPPPSFGSQGYPSTVYPSQSPSTLFPSGFFGSGGFGGGLFNSSDPNISAFRLLQGPRLRHTHVTGGDDATDLGTNDTDVSVAFAFPNFLYSTQPLYVIPSFSLHLWDGPAGISADLPSNAYSGFIDFGWFSDPNRMLSTEFGIRVGAFTDFDTFNSKSIRVLGKAIANFRWTPASTLKLGVIYLDRNNIKLVPAGGILYQPNPYSRYDIFFPQPKFSHYWRTVGTQDFWWYLAGDYGGGSWTIERTNGSSDSIDINEIRILLGMEWGRSDFIRTGRRTGFIEVGYAFDREIEYRFNPADNINPDDGFVIRAGIGY